jgi:hypothetical protein
MLRPLLAIALLVLAPSPGRADAPAGAADAEGEAGGVAGTRETPETFVLAALSARPAPAAPALPAIGAQVELRLLDGQLLRGRYVGQSQAGLQLEVAGGRIAVPLGTIRAIGAAGTLAPPRLRDANRTRYLYSPSGFMLRRGEGYLSQTELALSSVSYGLTDWLTVQAGTVIPLAVYDPKLTPGIFAVKVGGALTPRWHLAGGFQTLVLPSDKVPIAMGFLFGTATWGTEDFHVGLSAGPPFALSGTTSDLGDVLVSLSANWRAFASGALVSENWLVRVGGERQLVGSLAYRFIAERIAVDIGLVFTGVTNGVPIPWLDFTWHWGR